ncbi:MAG: sugar ABC transporter permease [Clostridiales bacterium]|nr:sugar ABC transporter permease [Clostridiales bacterium]
MDKALNKDGMVSSESVSVSTEPVAAKKNKKSRSLDKQKSVYGWIFILPFLIGFFVLYLPMIFDSLKFSFCEMSNVTGGFELEFVGFKNYSYALGENTEFVETLVTSIGGMVFDIPAIIIFSLFMAILLNQDMKGRAIFRAIFFVPVIVSTGIVESIDLQNTLAATGGTITTIGNDAVDGATNVGTQIINAIDVERFFASMKVGTGLVNYVTSWVNNVYDIVNRSGVQMLIFLAGLQSISPAIYESCRVEGATSWETFWKITFPMISPMILVNAVYTIIDSFTTDSNTVMKFIAAKYTQTNGNVISSAMSWIYFLIVMLIVGVVAAIFSGVVFYQKKD